MGVIAPYSAQTRLVRAMLRDYDDQLPEEEHMSQTIACSTVHQFQGSERDVIIFDTVESYPKKPGILTSKNENGTVDRLVNVAVTRARGKLVTVSNADYWEPPMVDEGNAFRALIRHQRINDRTVSVRHGGVGKFFAKADLGPNIHSLPENDAQTCLLQDVTTAVGRIYLSLPDAHLHQPFASQLYAAVHDARARGVDVRAKCLDTRDLPEDWKTITYQSDDALFPLVFIDNDVCWYGMPTSRMAMPSEDGIAPATTLQTALRFTGEKTLEMIWSLANLDVRVTADGIQTLRQRRGTTADDQDGDKPYGFALHVMQTKKCPECGAAMRLKVGYETGKYYLRCPSCRKTAALKRNDIDHYLSVSQARCPRCGGELYVGYNKWKGYFLECDGEGKHVVGLGEV